MIFFCGPLEYCQQAKWMKRSANHKVWGSYWVVTSSSSLLCHNLCSQAPQSIAWHERGHIDPNAPSGKAAKYPAQKSVRWSRLIELGTGRAKYRSRGSIAAWTKELPCWWCRLYFSAKFYKVGRSMSESVATNISERKMADLCLVKRESVPRTPSPSQCRQRRKHDPLGWMDVWYCYLITQRGIRVGNSALI